MIWFLRGRQAATSPGWNIVCVAFRGRGGSRASGGLYKPAGGGGQLFVCCRKSNCQSVWLWAVGLVMVHGPRGPWLPRPAAHAVHRRSASAQRAPTQGPASTPTRPVTTVRHARPPVLDDLGDARQCALPRRRSEGRTSYKYKIKKRPPRTSRGGRAAGSWDLTIVRMLKCKCLIVGVAGPRPATEQANSDPDHDP